MRLPPHHVSQPETEPSARTDVVPAVLPQVIATFDDTGTVRVTVDGVARPDGPTSCEELGRVLAGIADEHGGPVRVEVREPDGSRYADILQPRLPEPKTDAAQDDHAPGDGPLLRGEGFLPGETVLVAVVATSTHADQDGAASLADSPKSPLQASEVVLFGSASGTIVRASLPARPTRRWWRR